MANTMYWNLFCLLLCKILVGSCENFQHLENVEQTDDVYMGSKMENCDFANFKKVVMQELNEIKNGKIEMQNEILQLKEENLAKERKIEELEQRVEELKKGQGHVGVKGRRYISENVAFTAYLEHSVHNLTHDQPIIYNKVLLNDGDGYNVKTGMFRAPVSGVYLFSYSVGAKILPGVHLHQYDVFTRLMIDGTHQLSAVAESTDIYDDEQGSTTAIVYVEEASNVWVKHEVRGGNNLYADTFERVTSFAGTLLYEKEKVSNSAIIG